MSIDVRKAGKALLIVNFVLAAGIVAAGTDLFSPVSAPVKNETVFREVKPPAKQQAEAGPDYTNYSGVTSDRFRALHAGGSGPSAAPGVAAAIENSYRVTGTMISNNEKLSCAVIEDVRTKAQHTVFAGDVIGPVEITAIRPEEVEVRMQGQTLVLKLDATAPTRGAQQRGRGRNPEAERRQRPDRPKGGRNPESEPRGSAGAADDQKAAANDADAPGAASSAAPAAPSGISPELRAYWEKLPAEERKRWENWWNGKSPEERKKWEARLTQIARERAGR